MQRGVYITSHPSLSIVPFSRRSSSIPRLVDLATAAADIALTLDGLRRDRSARLDLAVLVLDRHPRAEEGASAGVRPRVDDREGVHPLREKPQPAIEP